MVLQYPGIRNVYVEDNALNEILTWVARLRLPNNAPSSVQNITGELHHSRLITIEGINVMSNALLQLIKFDLL